MLRNITVSWTLSFDIMVVTKISGDADFRSENVSAGAK